MAAKAGEIADGEDGVGVAVLAEDEIVDAPDRLVLVVDDRFQLDGFGAVASRDLGRLQGRQGDFLCRGAIRLRNKSDDCNNDRG